MAYVAYSGLTTPNEVIEKMADFIQTRGYTIIQPLADDLNIYDMAYTDGKRFTFLDRTGTYFINLRSANGTMIFGTKNDPQMDVTPLDLDSNYTGVGMTVSEGYTSVGRWYNQYKAPKKLGADDIGGVFMPMKAVAATAPADWQPNTAYSVGDVVLDGGIVYTCVNDHTSGASLSMADFKANPTSIQDWATNQNYTVGDLVKIGSQTYICNRAHTSTSSPSFMDFTVISKGIEDWEPNTQYYSGGYVDSSGITHSGSVVRVGGTGKDNNLYVCTNTHYSGSTISTSDFAGPFLYQLIPSTPVSPYTYTLYCNNPTTPTDTIVFTLMKEDDVYHQCTHLVYSNLDKYDVWEGGALFSGSSVKQLMPNDVKVYEHTVDSDKYILPILSSGNISNSFLRINIDGAPTEARGNIYWASSGTDNPTGKKLSLPIRLSSASGSTTPGGNGKIPHYWYLQSKGRLDWGRNINTLNCITIDMPIFAAVCVDPDVLDNYAAVGTVTGVWCISTLNMQTSYVYEKSYPRSGDLCQIFPHGKRRGVYGFDGISIKQADP